MRVNTIRELVLGGLISLALALVGFLIVLTGLGTPGPCADVLGALANIFVGFGSAIGCILLLTAGVRIAWHRLTQPHP